MTSVHAAGKQFSGAEHGVSDAVGINSIGRAIFLGDDRDGGDLQELSSDAAAFFLHAPTGNSHVTAGSVVGRFVVWKRWLQRVDLRYFFSSSYPVPRLQDSLGKGKQNSL